MPRSWVDAILAAGVVPASYVPDASVGRTDLEEFTGADPVEDAELQVHSLAGARALAPAAVGFLDGIEQWRVVGYAGVTPIVRAYVAAAIRLRGADRRPRTVVEDAHDLCREAAGRRSPVAFHEEHHAFLGDQSSDLLAEGFVHRSGPNRSRGNVTRKPGPPRIRYAAMATFNEATKPDAALPVTVIALPSRGSEPHRSLQTTVWAGVMSVPTRQRALRLPGGAPSTPPGGGEFAPHAREARSMRPRDGFVNPGTGRV